MRYHRYTGIIHEMGSRELSHFLSSIHQIEAEICAIGTGNQAVLMMKEKFHRPGR